MRTISTFIVLSLLLAALPTPASAASPIFEPSACMFELPAGVQVGVDVECGYLTVPEEHANPDGPTIQLAVAIIKSKQASPKLDPLVMAQGGPGGSTIDTYAEHLITNSDLRADRDIVLFDQRGTLYSRPSLVCKEIDQLTLDTIEKDLTDEEANRLNLEAMTACHQRLVNEGVNLSAFDSVENADDIADLRQALGYDKINLYGVSYGTLLALHTVRQHPEMLRSVIIDGVVPPQTNFLLHSPRTMDASFTRLFQTCAADPDCNRSYPNLEGVFDEVYDKLEKEPARVPMTDPDSSITYNAVVDGETFMYSLFQMLYAGSLIPALPRMIYEARDSEFTFFARIMTILIFDRTMSYGMYYSVLCAEDNDFSPADQDLSGVRPIIAEAEKGDLEEFQKTCAAWNVESLGPDVDQPVSSDIPTLVLSGSFDPITPPIYAEEAAKTLSHSYQIVFPAGGHGQAMEGDCQDGIILAFLDNPDKSPDITCIQGIEKPVYYTRANTLDMPVIIHLLNLEGGSGIQFGLLVLGTFFLLSATLSIPIIWIVVRLRRRRQIRAVAAAARLYPVSGSPGANAADMTGPQYAPINHPEPATQTAEQANISGPVYFLISAAGWLAALAGPTLLIFLTGLTVVLFNMINANDNRLFFGVSAEAWPLFILPLLFALLTLIMLLAGVLAWVKSAWSIWTRLYYTLLVSTALVCLVVLVQWGTLSALF